MKRIKPIVFMMAALALMLTAPLMSMGAAAQAPTAGTPPPKPDYDRTGWPKELNCGLFGGDDAEQALEGQAPLAHYISDYLGMPVKYTVGTSYNAVIESMRSGHTNCGTVGSFSYILAVQEAGAEALAIRVTADSKNPVYDPSIRPAYFSVISVKKGSGISSLADLKGKQFAFVDPASTSGHLIPSADLTAAGIDPEHDMKTIYAGSHPSAGIALWNGKVDAASTTETTLVNLGASGQIKYCGFSDGIIGKDRSPEEIKAVYDACPNGSIVAIHYSAPIPNSPFSVSSKLPATLKQAIKDALLSIKYHPELIKQIGAWYSDPNIEQHLGLPHLDNYYDGLRKVAKTLDLDLKSLDSQ